MRYNYVPESGPASDAFDAFMTEIHTPFPVPEISSRSAQALTFPMPRAVTSLAEFARGHDWEVIAQYSRGCFPHGTTGNPGSVKDVIGLRFGYHPLTARRAYAVYARTAQPAGPWQWDNTMIWGTDCTPFPHCSVTDLRWYLEHAPDLSARELAEWKRELLRNLTEKAEAARLRAKSRSGPAREGMR